VREPSPTIPRGGLQLLARSIARGRRPRPAPRAGTWSLLSHLPLLQMALSASATENVVVFLSHSWQQLATPASGCKRPSRLPQSPPMSSPRCNPSGRTMALGLRSLHREYSWGRRLGLTTSAPSVPSVEASTSKPYGPPRPLTLCSARHC
jgi:hypothetical protein